MARAKTYDSIRTILRLERLRSSNYGNPRFRVFFTDGSVAQTSPNSGYAYEIENEGHASNGVPLVVTFTAAGQVAYARIATAMDLKHWLGDDNRLTRCGLYVTTSNIRLVATRSSLVTCPECSQ